MPTSADANQRSPLSILYVVHGFPPHTRAGTEVYTLSLAQKMRERGHAVAIAARAPARPGAGPDDPPDWTIEPGEQDGLTVLRVIRRIDGLTIRETYQPEHAARAFVELLDRTHPDVVHFQHLLHLSPEWVHAARARSIATVITCNDYWPLCARVQLIRPDGVRCEENQGMGCFVCLKERHYRWIPLARISLPLANPFAYALRRVARSAPLVSKKAERFFRPRRGKLAHKADQWIAVRERQDFVLGCFGAADLVLCPSRFLRDKLAATGRFDPARLVHSDYGMNTAQPLARAKTKSADGFVRFGFVGSLVPYKGIEVLVQAMRSLAQRACRLDVYGVFHPETDAFHARLAELARTANVRFHGGFDNARLAEIYRELDVLVVPSLWFENSPLTIHEAFLYETPVVTSGIGGMAELVRDGVDGLHFRVGNAHDLAAKLARFLDEPDLLSSLSRDWMRVKTIAEDAAETEARYFALLERAKVGVRANVSGGA